MNFFGKFFNLILKFFQYDFLKFGRVDIYYIVVFLTSSVVAFLTYDKVAPAYEEVLISGTLKPKYVIDIGEKEGGYYDIFHDPRVGPAKYEEKEILSIKFVKLKLPPTFSVKIGDEIYPICVFPYVGPFSSYLQRISLKIFGENIMGSRFFGILFFVLASLLIFKTVYDKKRDEVLALFSALWYSTHPVAISFYVYGPNLYYAVMNFGCAFLFYSIVMGKNKFTYIIILILTLTHLVSLWIIASYFVCLAFMKRWREIYVSIPFVFLGLTPYILFSILFGIDTTSPYFGETTLSMIRQLGEAYQNKVLYFIIKIASRVGEIVNNFFIPIFYIGYLNIPTYNTKIMGLFDFESTIRNPIVVFIFLGPLFGIINSIRKKFFIPMIFNFSFFVFSLSNPVIGMPWQLTPLFIPTAFSLSFNTSLFSILTFSSIISNVFQSQWFFSNAPKCLSVFSPILQKELADFFEKIEVFEPANLAENLGFELYTKSVRSKNYFFWGKSMPLEKIILANKKGEKAYFIVKAENYKIFEQEAKKFGNVKILINSPNTTPYIQVVEITFK